MVAEVARGALGAWVGLRTRWRGLALPVFASPLLPAALLFAIGDDDRAALGAVLGFGASLLAARVLRRGRTGDARRASFLMAAGTGLAASLAGDMGSVMPFVFGAGALFGTRMMYQALPEVAPPPPPPKPEPVAVPAAPDRAAGVVAESRARLARIEAVAERRADPRLRGVASAMEGVLDDLTQHPDRLPQARRFLAVHLDGLERITARLEAGAAAPEGLPPLLDELTRTAGELRERLSREESAALEIQVKVLSDRLREEGYR
ncbi:hypothetical protein QWZ14_06730 [Paeniroseomonas aquatica]|uniref:FUSC family protein n=1 Tax=Paeniroseomonas aquatica TaxID=373043 RepID=A0ABT8A2W8_9PROT|nr:hypothetical protein [Paeniroseomonas aquatica]MDN3564072.1 hypothetical protein [Paeniroseomonas aquatica]